MRAPNALAQILEAFIAKELQPWVKTFPNEYYEQLFRLRGIDYDEKNVRRPQYFGLSEIWRVYGKFSATQLSNMTHDEGTPWKDIFDKYQGRIPRNTDITRDAMRDWFDRERSG